MCLYTCVGVGDTTITSGAQNLHAKSAIHANEPVEESPSLFAFDRKRAKSYPSERPSDPLAMLELPKQPEPIEEEEAEEEEENGVSSFTLSVSCRMAAVLSVAYMYVYSS